MTLSFTNRSGIGDDLMVFWAAAAAVMSGVVSSRLSLYFENPVSRSFLLKLAPLFPEIGLLESPDASGRLVVVRSKLGEFNGAGLGTLLRRKLFGKIVYCDPYAHKKRSEFGSNHKTELTERFAMAIGLLRTWRPPYAETYDGWQQLSMGLGHSKRKAGQTEAALASAWRDMNNRLCRWLSGERKDSGLSLFLPSGGSFQDFGEGFVSLLKTLRPDLKIVRFRNEPQPADIYFESLEELSKLIFKAGLVVTNDSLSSHLAQFLSKRHVLICTRSRPGNVCFPGSANTQTVDLGMHLECRPCAYYTLGTAKQCAAGFARCKAQVEVSPDKMRSLCKTLQ